MIITRKIELSIGQDATKEQRSEYIHQLYTWRDLIRKAANIIVSHKFVQQYIRDFSYIQEDILERFMEINPEAVDKEGNPRFYVKDILKNEPGNSEQNTTYRIASSYLKGKCPAEFFSCLNQMVSKKYKEKIAEFVKGKASLPSYSNIPLPFPGKKLNEMVPVERTYTDEKTKEEKTVTDYTLNFYHIPIRLFFGHDRSHNRVIIERALKGEYKFCGSSILIDDNKKKIFLMTSVDIPVKKHDVNPKNILYTVLGFEQPILCAKNTPITDENGKDITRIGNKEEFLHRRYQIQAALIRLRKACKYNMGGRGRKSKMKATERFREKEKAYIDTKMHQYSRMLVNTAIKKGCGTIHLSNLEATNKMIESLDENDRKMYIRNWGYHGLVDKINYKARLAGIEVTYDKAKK